MERTQPSIETRTLPPLVRSRVAVARRGLHSVRWFQGLCLGLAAALVALAAGLHGSDGVLSPSLFVAAGVNGVLVLLLWGLTHRASAAQVAREVDRALGENGALFTAWEIEGQPQPSPIAQRLAQEVAGGAPPGRMLRSILPMTLPLLAVPFAACALLFSAMEGARRDASQEDIEGVVAKLREGIGAVVADAPGSGDGAAQSLSALERQELQQLMRQVGDLGKDLQAGEAAPEEIEDIQEKVAELGERLASESSEQLRNGLERTQAALDSARMSLEGGNSSGANSPSNQDSGGGKGSSAGTGLAKSGEVGRMGAQNPPSPRASQALQPGVLGSPSWPAAYDGIVRRWVESARQ
jgi:hypothetical protein